MHGRTTIKKKEVIHVAKEAGRIELRKHGSEKMEVVKRR
jgi:hypothetical protein